MLESKALLKAPKMLFNSTEGARDFGDHCKYDSKNRKRVQPRGSHLKPNPRTNKQPDHFWINLIFKYPYPF